MTASKPALVFGASGEQGRAVIEGFVDAGYNPIYGFTSNSNAEEYADQYLSDALGCILLQGDISNPKDVEQALRSTKAQAIFVVTTTDLANAEAEDGGMAVSAMEEEFNVIVQWFVSLKKVHAQDQLPRTVVLSVRDNVQELCRHQQNQDWITPLDDGSIVPHYSGTLCSSELYCVLCMTNSSC
jgi:NAD(P)-dependent dehydrogenase (short-subunit alcohol dehydrogenase family)